MASTTLITFMVRTPPTTRQVSLYGSWDNFTKPYPMHRDSRVGREHWSGCHNFSNIICDGTINLDAQIRQGGLKMGGTYWYYYKLDDDLDFHNSAEPSTTLCPMLPGQLLNVLYVPIALSGNRARSGSVSSTSSDNRTMNPSDKFMNPRPVPKPRLPRLKTSPTFTSSLWSSNSSPLSPTSRRAVTSGDNSSHPNSAGALKKMCLSRTASFDRSTRSTSPASSISDGIKSAFRSLLSSRPNSPDHLLAESCFEISHLQDSTVLQNSRHHSQRTSSLRDISPNTTNTSSKYDVESKSDLALRRAMTPADIQTDGVPFQSFQQHRRQRSQSREPSSLRNSMTLDDSASSKLADVITRRPLALETLKEVSSAQNTPGLPITAIKDQTPIAQPPRNAEFDLEKRLPTLPSTPSSAYPPSTVADDSPRRRFSLEIANLQSHFSCTTIDTNVSAEGHAETNLSRLSHWSLEGSTGSRLSAHHNSLMIDEQIDTSDSELYGRRGRRLSKESPIFNNGQALLEHGALSSTLSCSTISSTVSSSFTTSPVLSQDHNGEFNSSFRRTTTCHNGFQHYSLPPDEHCSETTLKSAMASETNYQNESVQPYVVDLHRRASSSHSQSSVQHSVNMQQLLHELSYLSDVIQQK